jgi:Flp pilus assembly protein TadD
MLVVMRRNSEALAVVTRARELDPLSVPINAFVGVIYMTARQSEQAIAASRKAIELDPNNPFAHWILARSLDAQNELPETLGEAEKAVSLSGRTHPFAARLGYAYARIDDTVKARQAVDQLMELSRNKYVSPYDIALIYTGLAGERPGLCVAREGLSGEDRAAARTSRHSLRQSAFRSSIPRPCPAHWPSAVACNNRKPPGGRGFL